MPRKTKGTNKRSKGQAKGRAAVKRVRKSGRSVQLSQSVRSGTIVKVAQEESKTKRHIHEKTRRNIHREIVEEKDGQKRIKEHEVTEEVKHTYEEEIKRRIERSAETYVTRLSTAIMQEYSSQLSERMFEWDVDSRRRAMSTLPDEGLYRHLGLPLEQALALQCEEWEKVRDALSTVDVEEKGKVATNLNIHLGSYFKTYSKNVSESKKEHEVEKKATAEMSTGNFPPEVMKFIDVDRYSDEYIMTTYKVYYDNLAEGVFMNLQGHGYRINQQTRTAFMKAMGGLPSPEEILQARKFKDCHDYKDTGEHGGYTLKELQKLYPEYEPCLPDRVRFVERFNQGDFGLLKSLYLSIYVRYHVVNGSLENLRCLEFKALDNVTDPGDGGQE